MKNPLWIIILFFVACSKESDPAGPLFGTYSGTFVQSGDVKDSASVRIVFIGSNFSGESSGSARDICNGSYTVFSDSIRFTNLCSTPDNGLLLYGTYRMRETGDSLYMIRQSPNGIAAYTETFSLKK